MSIKTWWNDYKHNWHDNFADGYQPGDILASLFGNRNYSGSFESTNPSQKWSLWGDITGQTNTQMQNSAAAALQDDAQAFNSSEAEKERKWQEYMSNTAVQRQAADLQSAGFNPALAATGGASSGVAASATSGIGSAQASNVSALQSIANTAITAGMLIKILKTISK